MRSFPRRRLDTPLGLVTACLFSLVGACSDGGGGIKQGASPTLEAFVGSRALDEGELVELSAAGLPAGDEAVAASLRFINSGDADLHISSLTVDSTPAGAFRLAADPTTLAALGAGPFTIAPVGAAGGATELSVHLVASHAAITAAAAAPTAIVTIHSDHVGKGGVTPVVRYYFVVEPDQPRLAVVPAVVDFGTVPEGETRQKSVNLLNQGTAPVLVSGAALTGDASFALVVGSTTYPAGAAQSAHIVIDPPLSIAPGTSAPLSALFTADGSSAARATLTLTTNDPLSPGGTVVPLQGNVRGACVALSPPSIDFGGKLVGQLATIAVEVRSCGDEALTISELGLTEDSSTELTLHPPTLPLTIAPGDKATVSIDYLPEDVTPRLADGGLLVDRGTLRIVSNAFQPEVRADVTGFGVDTECPTAMIAVTEGREVIPQTVLHLVGSGSFVANGHISEYAWTASQPAGAQSLFLPSPSVADPTFEVDVSGTYRFTLTVKDDLGRSSCAPASVEVYVNPAAALHVELLWDTPLDPDQSDEGLGRGADLDLHFLHPFATGGFDGDHDGQPDGYFDTSYDCFWDDAMPAWGEPTADDNPTLDRDDTNGAGPENINVVAPQDGVCYRVGVHYWDDHDFGQSTATLRVYAYAQKVLEVVSTPLANSDMWSVGEICWPLAGAIPTVAKVCANTTTACTSSADCGGAACGLRIAHGYRHPAYP
ncbi:MAG: choice-of-anchor D domain-containing protein [Myxococcota bacterium]